MTYYENENILYVYLSENDSKEDLWKKFKVIYDDLVPIPLMLFTENNKEFVALGQIVNNNRNRLYFQKCDPRKVISTDKLSSLIHSLIKLQEKIDS